MKIHIYRIIKYCKETENKHFEWFVRILEKHMHGMTTHVSLQISSGKVEGLNHMIKKIRRQGFRYPDGQRKRTSLYDCVMMLYQLKNSADIIDCLMLVGIVDRTAVARCAQLSNLDGCEDILEKMPVQ